jgi:hypothetical protein
LVPEPLAMPAILTDEGGFPLAYVLPPGIGGEALLVQLSCVASAADARLLSLLLEVPVERLPTGLPAMKSLPGQTDDGFMLHADKLAAWGRQCVETVRLLARRRGGVELALYHPYHAGDVLFFGLAASLVEQPLYRRQIVYPAYRDIWRESGASLAPILAETKPPPQPRPADYRIEEGELFELDLGRLPAEAGDVAVTYCRASRDYNASPFHLIDQARFALGEDFTSDAQLADRLRLPRQHCAVLPRTPLRILLCLQGGWSLKAYPRADRAVLVATLQRLGCAVSMLDPPAGEADGAVPVTGGTTGKLRALLEAHHVMVSIDSFPHHYAHFVLGHPTIGLFGNTWPGNSQGVASPGYRMLSGHRACNPCRQVTRCLLDGGPECANFPSPAAVATAVFDLADAIYGTEDGR